MSFRRFTILLSFSLIIFQTAKAQTAYEFLKVDLNARAAALAGSFVSNNDDPNVLFYNPAGINFHESTPVSFSFLKYFLDINSYSVAMSHEFPVVGRMGVGIQYMNYGDFVKADENGNRLGEFGAYDMALLLGYGGSLGENVYYGATGKIILSSIDEFSSSAFAFDLGLHYTLPESQWNFGFSILNIGSQISKYGNVAEDLPLDMRLGFSKKLERVPFRFFFSFNQLNEDRDNFTDKFQSFTLGGEIYLSKVLTLRLGYDNEKRKDLKIGATTGLAGFNIGVGAMISAYQFDYAYSSWGLVGGLHRISASTAF